MNTKVGLAGVLFTALLVGSLVSAGQVPLVDDNNRTNTESTGAIVSKDGPGCIDDVAAAERGWIAISDDGQAADVQANATVAHSRGAVVDVTAVDAGDGVYELRITTDEPTVSSRVPVKDANCGVGTQVDAYFQVPADFEAVRVRVDGDVVATVASGERREPLPNPVNGTASDN
jgi:hypothetical protein